MDKNIESSLRILELGLTLSQLSARRRGATRSIALQTDLSKGLAIMSLLRHRCRRVEVETEAQPHIHPSSSCNWFDSFQSSSRLDNASNMPTDKTNSDLVAILGVPGTSCIA